MARGQQANHTHPCPMNELRGSSASMRTITNHLCSFFVDVRQYVAIYVVQLPADGDLRQPGVFRRHFHGRTKEQDQEGTQARRKSRQSGEAPRREEGRKARWKA